MKRPHILPVFLVSLGYCFGQTPVELFQPGQTTESATISLAHLRHKIPGKALAAFSRALKLARHREWQQGARELEAAVAADPDFSDAHGNLGVHYMMLHQVNQAIVEFRRAIALDSATSMHHSFIPGFIGNIVLFFDRQGVHIRAKHEGWTVAIAQHANHACLADAGRHFLPGGAKMFRSKLRGPDLLHRKFRMSVDVLIYRLQFRQKPVER